jgi:lysozyme
MPDAAVFSGVIDDLKRDEGLRLKPYRCTSGCLSIGYGRNLQDNGIRLGEAEQLLINDVKGAIDDLDRSLPWWRDRSPWQQRALIQLCFNMGIRRLLGFQRMLAALQAGNGAEAATEVLASKWAGQVGERADRIATLLRRG